MIRIIQILTTLLMVSAWTSVSWAQESTEAIADTGKLVSDSGSRTADPISQPFQMGDETPVNSGMESPVARSLRSPSFFKSPTGTLLKSVAFPGWGQWSNGKKQKSAIYFAIESYWITKALVWRHRARVADDLAEFAHARDRRNYFYWLTGITVFISMFDAYSDRYLLTLERTRNMPDEFWGQGQLPTTNDDWRFTLAIKF